MSEEIKTQAKKNAERIARVAARTLTKEWWLPENDTNVRDLTKTILKECNLEYLCECEWALAEIKVIAEKLIE